MLLEVDPPNLEEAKAEVYPRIRRRHPSWPGWVRGHWYAREYAWVLGEVGDLRGLRVMDAGGCTSVLSAILSDRGAREVVVADLRPPQPYPARGRITPMCCDLQDTGLEGGTFDCIVSASAIEHNQWEDQVRIVRHLLGLLHPGGRLLVTLPAVRTADEAWLPDFRGRGCVYLWTHAAARRMREAVGDLGRLETPLLDDPQYDVEVVRIGCEMRAASPDLPDFPYQSMALAWRRR